MNHVTVVHTKSKLCTGTCCFTAVDFLDVFVGLPPKHILTSFHWSDHEKGSRRELNVQKQIQLLSVLSQHGEIKGLDGTMVQQGGCLMVFALHSANLNLIPKHCQE